MAGLWTGALRGSQWHQPPLTCLFFSLAPGNYCPICTRCYEDNDYESKMMQCAQCDHWVHAKCEGLSGEWVDYLGGGLSPLGIPVLPFTTGPQGTGLNVLGDLGAAESPHISLNHFFLSCPGCSR